MNTMPFTNTDPIFMQLEKKASYWSLSLEERQLYDRSLMAWRDQQNQMKYAMTEARTVALEEGRAEGRAEEKIEMARALKQLGVDIIKISTASGLSVVEIENL